MIFSPSHLLPDRRYAPSNPEYLHLQPRAHGGISSASATNWNYRIRPTHPTRKYRVSV